jgi:hypothetical protein
MIDGNIYDTKAHYQATTKSNANIDIISKYDTTIKSYSSLDKIQQHQPHILTPDPNLLALETDQKTQQQPTQKLSAPCL